MKWHNNTTVFVVCIVTNTFKFLHKLVLAEDSSIDSILQMNSKDTLYQFNESLAKEINIHFSTKDANCIYYYKS